MPRMVRLDVPGGLVHVMARGIEGREIFLSDEDRFEFLNRFARHIADADFKCLSWCLMGNHYHMLLRTSANPLSKLMRPLNGGYARWFNKKYERRGYLFQDRFKSVLCQDQDYARQLIRYIHLNPIRSGIVQSLSALKYYKWCGHAFLLGRQNAFGARFHDRAQCLTRFGKEKESVARYIAFLEESLDIVHTETAGELAAIEKVEISGSFKGWPAVIGDAKFAQEAMLRRQDLFKRKHRKSDYQHILDNLADEICRKNGIGKDELFMRGKSNMRSQVRALFCFRAHYQELIPLAVIAGFLGITISPVERLAKKAATKPKE